MKIVFYLMAVLAAAFGVLCLLRGVDGVMNGNFSALNILIGVVGIFLAMIWMRRARAWRPVGRTSSTAPDSDTEQ